MSRDTPGPSDADLAAWIVARTRAAGARDCRVRLSRRSFASVRFRDRRPEFVSNAATRSVSLEVFSDRHYAAQQTPDLRRDSLERFVAEVVERAGIAEEDPFCCLPDPDRYLGRASLDLGLADPGRAFYGLGERHALAKGIEAACLDLGGDSVVSVEATVYDHAYEERVLTSNGFEGSLRATEFWSGAQMSVQDAGDRKPTVDHFVGARRRGDVPGPEAIGSALAQRARRTMGARKRETGTLTVLVENRCAGRLLGAFLDAMTGRNIQQKQSFLAGKMGGKVGSAAFTLTDEPFLAGGLGSRLYDHDGLPARRRVMVDRGTLKDAFIDWYYSRKLGLEPTTGGPSNLVLGPGARPLDAIVGGLKKCLVVTDFIGGNSNPATGDFSLGVLGSLFEGGQPARAVSEMNIAGNHLDFWGRLVETGNDPWPYSALRTPSLVFDGVVVSGN